MSSSATHEPVRQIERSGLLVRWVRRAFRERLDVDPVDLLRAQALEGRAQERTTDPSATGRSTHRHPRDLRGTLFAIERPREETDDAGLVARDETGVRPDRLRAVSDALLVPEPVGQPGDDRVADIGITRFEVPDGHTHGGQAYDPYTRNDMSEHTDQLRAISERVEAARGFL